MDNKVYINGLGCVSPQNTTDWTTPVCYDTNQLRCIDPGYKEFIPAESFRRMGRVIKMGVAAAKLCIKDAANALEYKDNAEISPDGIITGTGLGCMEDTEKFLASMIKNNEEFLTPTSFIQSTHNTVAGQIALLLKCHGYNFTFVHRGISFESALLDAMMQIQSGTLNNVLAGASDELTSGSFTIMSRLGFWKQKPIRSLDLLIDQQRGTIAGEGATFFFLGKNKNEHTYASVDAVSTFLKPVNDLEIIDRLKDFLASNSMEIKDIDLVFMGLNGDPQTDKIYHLMANTALDKTPQAYFKHMCGEFHTASAYASWLSATILKKQTIPGFLRTNDVKTNQEINKILIYNHFRENNHAFILLSRP